MMQATSVAAGTQSSSAPAPYPDPLSPEPEGNPKKESRFKKTDDRDSMSLQPPPAFTLPPSGIGTTGFDASNAPKTSKAQPQPGSAANAQATTQDALTPEPAFGPATSTSPPVAPSPYQTPPPPLATSALAQAPGSPPAPAIGPIRKPLKKHKVRESDPYAPLGIRAGAFDLYPSIDILGGYDSNPEQATGGKGSSLYSVAPELRVQSDWSRHSFKADLRGSYTGYSPDRTPTLSRPYFESNVNGRIDVSDRTHILLDGHTLVSTDNPNSPNLQSGLAKLPLYTVFGGDAGLDHRFNRFEITLKGAAQRTVYQNSELTNGTTASNEDQNYNQYGGTLRGSYDLLPGVKPYVEIEADSRVHDLNTDFSGYQRDSKGVTGTIGTTFKLSDLLTGEAAIGYTERNYQDARLPTLNGFIGNASLISIRSSSPAPRRSANRPSPAFPAFSIAMSACSSITPSGAG
jgi:hypothetical protein